MLLKLTRVVNSPVLQCVSKGIMSPLTAKVKCPHDGGQSEFEPETVEKVASVEDGVGRAYLLERSQ
jgi:hypothetical protein